MTTTPKGAGNPSAGAHPTSTTDQPPAEPEAPAADVWQAWQRVMRDMPGIQKMTAEQHAARTGIPKAERGVTYGYRSIDQVLAETQRLFAVHGVVLIPKVEGPPTVEAFTMGSSGTRWTDTTMAVRYWVVGPGGATPATVAERVASQMDPEHAAAQLAALAAAGVDLGREVYVGDCFEAGPFHAVGRDNADKGTNKAMTMAEKQALLQLLQIGDPKDDPDLERQVYEGARHDAGKAPDRTPPADPLWLQRGYQSVEQAKAQVAALQAGVKELDDDGKAAVGAWLVEHKVVWTAEDAEAEGHPDWAGRGRLASVTAEQALQLAQVVGQLLHAAKAQQQDAGADTTTEADEGGQQGAAPAAPPSAAGEPAQDGQDSGAAAKDGTAADKRRRPRNPR